MGDGRLQTAGAVDPIVLDARRAGDGWRIVLAVRGAAEPAIAAAAVREALAVAAGFDPPTSLDLLVVDPDDATVEIRATAETRATAA